MVGRSSGPILVFLQEYINLSLLADGGIHLRPLPFLRSTRFNEKNAVLLILLILCLLSSCTLSSTSDTAYQIIKAPAFSGYICGYKGSETFLQLPIFIPNDKDLSANEINRITLSGDDAEFSCSDYRLSSFTESQNSDYKFSTLSFRVLLEESGKFSVSKLHISFSDGSKTELSLGKIDFDIQENQALQTEFLSMRQFFVNQTSPSTLRVSYFNNTDKDISITNFTYPSDVCSGIEIERYDDFELSIKEEGLIIPPKEEKTFLITFDFEKDFIENEGRFFYFLPFIKYEIDNSQIVMPGQTQATVVQIPFNETVVSEIVK